MRTLPALLPLVILAAACAGTTQPQAQATTWTFAPDTAPSASSAVAALVVEVYKSPTCTCCHEWEAYLRGLGYEVRSVPVDDIAAVKTERGVPKAAWSCHTAVIDGYVVEGHVPVEAIEDLFATRPAIDGIALAGMPAGSPGMPGPKAAPFDILAIDDGATTPFGSY